MFTKLCIVKVLVTILIMVYDTFGMDIKTKLIAPYKPANCFLPENCTECHIFHEPDNIHKIGAWHFDPKINACVPHIIDPQRPNCCPSINILPKTQKECDDMCGEPCTVTHANHDTEPGICMVKCFIEVPPGVSEPCKKGWFGVNCCPRGYEAPSFLARSVPY